MLLKYSYDKELGMSNIMCYNCYVKVKFIFIILYFQLKDNGDILRCVFVISVLEVIVFYCSVILFIGKILRYLFFCLD